MSERVIVEPYQDFDTGSIVRVVELPDAVRVERKFGVNSEEWVQPGNALEYTRGLVNAIRHYRSRVAELEAMQPDEAKPNAESELKSATIYGEAVRSRELEVAQ